MLNRLGKPHRLYCKSLRKLCNFSNHRKVARSKLRAQSEAKFGDELLKMLWTPVSVFSLFFIVFLYSTANPAGWIFFWSIANWVEEGRGRGQEGSSVTFFHSRKASRKSGNKWGNITSWWSFSNALSRNRSSCSKTFWH